MKRYPALFRGSLYRGSLRLYRCPACDGQRRITILRGPGLPASHLEDTPLPEDTLWLGLQWSSRSGKTWYEGPPGGLDCTVVGPESRPEQARAVLLEAGTRLRLRPEAWLAVTDGHDAYRRGLARWCDQEPVPGWLKEETVGVWVADRDVRLPREGEPTSRLCANCLAVEADYRWPWRQGHLYVARYGPEAGDHAASAAADRLYEPLANDQQPFPSGGADFFNHRLTLEGMNGSHPTGATFTPGRDSRRAYLFVGAESVVRVTSPDHPDQPLELGPGGYCLYHPWPARGGVD